MQPFSLDQLGTLDLSTLALDDIQFVDLTQPSDRSISWWPIPSTSSCGPMGSM